MENIDDPKTPAPNTGEAEVQQGEEVLNEESQNKVVNGEETSQEEFINDINTETVTNSSILWQLPDEEKDDEDDDDEEDDDDDPLVEVGDDPAETRKKIPVM